MQKAFFQSFHVLSSSILSIVYSGLVYCLSYYACYFVNETSVDKTDLLEFFLVRKELSIVKSSFIVTGPYFFL